MKLKWKSFDDLSFNAARFLISKMGRTQETAKQYVCYWRRIERYMKANKIKQFDSSFCKAYLMALFGNQDYGQLSKSQKDFIRAARVLSEFSDKGSIHPVKEQAVFHGPIGEAITAYLSCRISLRLNRHTVEEGEQHLYRFFDYLTKAKVTEVKEIDQLHILKFVKTIDPKFSTLTYRTLESIRGFLKYAYRESLIEYNLAAVVPKYNHRRQPKIPSVYSQGEIETIIAAIDRGDAVGKRNYAIVLLAARLGLRASDIANLKFENLIWDKSTIVLDQYKTGKRIELPILSEVGNAIIDYLRYGRPKSSERFIFLISQSPFRPGHRGAITGIVHAYFVKSGINITQRRHGPHALRHSLASILLEKETILPVISEVLGHQDTASTNYYLRIDLKSMSRCPLEVPPVPNDKSLIVRDSKNGKERLIPISSSLSDVLSEYAQLKKLLPVPKPESNNFFITLCGKSCDRSHVDKWFKKILWAAGISREHHGPRLHDLRHTFSVHSLAMMAKRDIDLYCSLPTLSTYLGHQSLEATNTYVRLTAEMYPGLLKDVDLICLNVFPNTQSYATH